MAGLAIALTGWTKLWETDVVQGMIVDHLLGYSPGVQAAAEGFGKRGASSLLAGAILSGQMVVEIVCAILMVVVIVALLASRGTASPATAQTQSILSIWSLPAYAVAIYLFVGVIYDLGVDGRLYEAFFDFAPHRLRWLPGYVLLSSGLLMALNLVYVFGIVGALGALRTLYDRIRSKSY